MKLRAVSKLGLSIGGIAIAGALFAGGFAAANAVDGDDTPTSQANAQTAAGAIRVPNVARETSGSAAISLPNAGQPGAPPATGFGADKANAYYPGPGPYFCQADLPPITTTNGFDLSRAGFTMRLLGSGFSLLSLNIWTEAECDDQGKPTGEQHLVLATNWRHGESGLQVSLTQREREKATANVRYPLSADFWNGGYQYQLYVNPGYYPLYAKDGGAAEPAIAPGAPSKPGILPVPDDPRSQEVLNAAIAQLVPSLGAECFYTQVRGSWADLGKLGIGDPRPAIPANYKETNAEVSYFKAPPASCNVATFDNQGQFFAGWVDEANGRYNGSINVNAYPVAEGQIPQLGWIDDYNASWTNGKWQFNVSGNRNDRGIGFETLRAVAKAMDPSFNDACFLRKVDIKPGDLAARGLREPSLPAGYSFGNVNLTAVELPKDCVAIPEAPGNSYSLYWEMTDGKGGNIINASLNRQDGGVERPQPGGTISDQFINWADARGAYYSVSGYGADGGSGPGQDVLIAVAKSLDPTLDVSTLEKIPTYGKPIPATRSAAP
ncbi:MAG: hypothetical protein ACKVVT_03910 [Dehalococcoidia bacterium]